MRVTFRKTLGNFESVFLRSVAVLRPAARLVTATQLVTVLILATASAEAAEGTPCALVEDAMRVASEIRGLTPRQAVPCRLQDRAQVEKFLLDTIQEKIPQDRLKYEGEIYRILGIIPKDFEYLQGIVDLYTSQLGGYYDPEKKFYAMASWMPTQLQFPIAVHELTHALQDQYYQLDKMMDHHRFDSDMLVARSALVEGDASAVMIDFSRQLSGQGPLKDEESVASLMLQNLAGAMLSSSFQEAPPALQAMLIFPYVSGLRFAHAILKTGGYPAIDRAFKKPPESAEHILHPEIYLRGERSFIDVPLPSAPEGVAVASTKPLFEDRLGEFFVSTFLGGRLPPQTASEAAAGWGGDRIALYQTAESERYILVWVLHWDSEKDTTEFFEALVRYYELRLSSPAIVDGEQRKFVDPDFGPVEIFRKDSHVRITVGR